MLLAAVVMLPWLGREDITTSHEARVAVTARAMAVSGPPWRARSVRVPLPNLTGEVDWYPMSIQANPWIIPVMNGEIRLQKPPLPYWCVAVLARVGGFGEWTARLPSVLLGIAATGLLYSLTRLIAGRRVAWLAGIVWVTTFFTVAEYRKAMADPYLALFSLMCVWAWVKAALEGRPAMLLVFYAALGLGMLAKGPVVFVHVTVPIVLWHICDARSRLRPAMLWHIGGALLFAAVVLPWAALVIAMVPDAAAIWRYESLGEFAENRRNARPFWAYLPWVFQIGLPWTPVWLVGMALPFRHGLHVAWRKQRRAMFAPLWLAVIVVFFSLAHVKKMAYLLPVMPSVAMVAAEGLRVVGARLRLRRREAGALAVGQAGIAAVAGGVVGVLAWHDVGRAWAIPLAAAALVLGAWGVSAAMKGRAVRWLGTTACGYMALLIALIGLHRADTHNLRSPRSMAEAIRAAAAAEDATILVPMLPAEVAIHMPAEQRYDPGRTRALVVLDKDGPIPEANAAVMRSLGRPVLSSTLTGIRDSTGRGAKVWLVQIGPPVLE
jgi:4-amino-4-deoxy-L-arabinose transferase-like glycosyltransferase